jgi:hypothetical protein
VQDVAAVVQVDPPGLAVTVYAVIAAPFGVADAVHEIEADPSAGTAATSVGSLGGPTGVAVTGSPPRDPPALRARTTNEYSVPFTSPLTVQEVSVVAHWAPPGWAVTT